MRKKRLARCGTFFVAGLCGLAAPAQTWSNHLHYLGEVGHLGTDFDPRPAATYGAIRVAPEEEGGLRVQGRDDSLRPWTAILPAEGGIGFTDLWRADFDGNGRQDLLVAALFPKNGRCVDEITLSFLLFDRQGRPVPWVIDTRMPESKGLPAIPALFADLEHGGRAELVVTDCSYSNPPRSGTDQRIAGIYVASEGRWSLARPGDLAPYTQLVRRSYRFRAGHDELLASDPARWADQGNAIDAHSAPVRVDAVLAPLPDCRSVVRLPPVVDGRLQLPWTNPCDEAGKDRLRLSDGTVCYGRPTVVLDRAGGREIVAEPKRLNAALQEVVDSRHAVVLTGQTDSGRCSPAMLWDTER